MRSSRHSLPFTAAFVALAAVVAPASAQDQFVMPDRNNDSIYRLRDVDHNGVITNTAAEVFLFFSAARLHDGDGDGLFTSAGESTNMLAGAGVIVQSRQIDLLPRLGDVVNNGAIDVNDLLAVIINWGGSCTPADIDCSGSVDVNDLLAVITHWGL